VLAGVPSLYSSLCDGVTPIESTNTESLRLLTSTGSKFPVELRKSVTSKFRNADLSLNYGLTETYRTASLPKSLWTSNGDSVGYAIPGVRVSVLREDNTEALANEVGEIVHSGLGVFAGYWNEPELTSLTLKIDPLWPHNEITAPKAVFTGDLGWKDEQGLLYIEGRRDRQIKTMGVRVSPDEIEILLMKEESVKEAAIVSKQHEILGELIVAFVVYKPGLDVPLKELKKYCKSCMNQYMIPREFNIVETLPKTASGKTDYVSLKKQMQ
jgi:acyl-coenzyme A synthetase/AMP-(fatty) acid ligase